MYLTNKYTTWYFSIISKASKRTFTEEYTEVHHILPKSLKGSDDPSNLVKLTAKEHFVCHVLLTKMLDGNAKQKMIYACWAMTNLKNLDQNRYKVSARIYKILKEEASRNHKLFKHSVESKRKISSALKGKTVSEETRQKMRDNAKNREREHYNKGSETRRKNPRIVSEETRLKISQALSRKKRLFTEEHKRNISVAKLGKKGQHIVSEETRLKISQALSGKKRLFTDEAKRNIAIAASNNFKGKTWKIVDGKRVWVER